MRPNMNQSNSLENIVLKNFNVNVDANTDADAGYSAIALPRLRPGELKISFRRHGFDINITDLEFYIKEKNFFVFINFLLATLNKAQGELL